jgi:probable rRNA maturation factor
MHLEVDVQYAVDESDGDFWLPDEETIEAWARAALSGRRDAAQFVVRIVGEEEGTQLNEQYRARKKGPTNVLSFPFEHPDLLDPPLLGDVVICAPVVAREAAEQDKTVQAHWAHLVIHGVFHLMGYDHEEESEAVIMESAERGVLAGLGFPDPYAGETATEDALPGGGS